MPDDTPDTQICCGLVLPIDRECPVCGEGEENPNEAVKFVDGETVEEL